MPSTAGVLDALWHMMCAAHKYSWYSALKG